MFITAHHDKYKDRILVWERHDGNRVLREFNCPYFFYVQDKLGDYEAITGEKLKKLTFNDKSSYDEACKTYSQKFESDLSPLEKFMMETYRGKTSPNLVIGFIDIEVDYDPKIGFPRPANPYAPINALTLYRSDVQDYFTFLVPPKDWVGPLPEEMLATNYFICRDERELFQMFFDMLDDVDLISGWNSDFFDLPYMAKRAELHYGQAGLKKFGFERAPTPYWGEQERFKGAKEKEMVLNIGSRVHLDYMRIFKKFNLGGRQSFSLAAIADDELHIPKLHYEGSLYELYHGLYRPNLDNLSPEFGTPAIPAVPDKVEIVPRELDEETGKWIESYEVKIPGVPAKAAATTGWDELYRAQVDREILYQEIKTGNYQSDDLIVKAYNDLDIKVKQLSFIKFSVYNRRDVEILVELDKKFRYIELASQMVHEATVNFPAIFGSVQLIDSAIINYCHGVLNKIVFDRKHKAGEKVEGALVMDPAKGFHRMIGSCDINSLYPSTYRSLNLSPEKIVGQLLEFEAGWKIIYDANRYPEDDLRQNKRITFRLEGTPVDEALSLTANEMIELLKDRKFAISAYGTILDQGNGQGLLPSVLGYWFDGRKELQGKKKAFAKKAAAIIANGGSKESPEYVECIEQSDYFDMLQGVRKVLLNSTYGATLNEFCRFHDPRLGASTTGTGRQITTHMINTAAVGLIGDNAPTIKKHVDQVQPKKVKSGTGGDWNAAEDGIQNTYTIECPSGLGPIYSDTDSCYFVMDKLTRDPEEAVTIADALVDVINDSFPSFMQKAFNCQPAFDSLIRANREIVATTGIFRAKKKYVMLAYDMEGTRIDQNSPKALKTQGSDIKISSTPEMIRTLLKDVTMMILREQPRQKIEDYIITFRRNLANIHNIEDLNILNFASVNSVKTLDEYFMKWERIEKPGMGRVTMPAGVRASINHNEFIAAIGEKDTQPIRNGMKCKVVWLRKNEYDFTNMAFASETEALPKWFIDNFEVDLKMTEAKLVDHKLSMIFEPMGWQVPTFQSITVNRLVSFD